MYYRERTKYSPLRLMRIKLKTEAPDIEHKMPGNEKMNLENDLKLSVT